MIIIIILQSLFGILPERHSFLERLKKKKKKTTTQDFQESLSKGNIRIFRFCAS